MADFPSGEACRPRTSMKELTSTGRPILHQEPCVWQGHATDGRQLRPGVSTLELVGLELTAQQTHMVVVEKDGPSFRASPASRSRRSAESSPIQRWKHEHGYLQNVGTGLCLYVHSHTRVGQADDAQRLRARQL